MNPEDLSRLNQSARYLRTQIAGRPEIAVVLGSGLGALAERLQRPTGVSYGAIPHMAESTVEGHDGELIYGSLRGKEVVCMKGRFHGYEGYRMDVVTYPIRLLKIMGLKTLILTNAAGGINPELAPSDLMVIEDHINLMGSTPLTGPNIDTWGPRFPDLSRAYSLRLMAVARHAAEALNLKLKQGVYAACLGPSYETPAEVRMLRTLGADAVGMSTVPEVIAANHLGMEVLAVSCITNAAAGLSARQVSHAEVTRVAERVKREFAALISAVVEHIDLAWEELERSG